MTIIDCRPFLAVGVSFFAAILIAFSRKWPNVREAWSAIASVIMFGIILSMVPGVLDGNQYEWTLCRITDTLGLTLKTDPAGMIFATLASMLWVPMNFYSIGYMRCNNEKNRPAISRPSRSASLRSWASPWRRTSSPSLFSTNS